MNFLESLVQAHGERYRRLILDSLVWLETHEPRWNLEQPINKAKFIEDLVRRAR